jgi:heavy metal sensor kinase
MTGSLGRTLALRFAATMAVGLAGVAAAAFWAASRVMQGEVNQAVTTAVVHGVQRDLLFALGALILLGGTATLVGAWKVVESAMRPVRDIAGQAMRIEAGTLDQRIVTHAETDEYRALVAVLNRMLERLEQGFLAQRRLTADMSHELRTPLTALRGEIEVALRADRSPREYQHVLRSALEESERLSRMAEDLLLITRAESHLLHPEIGPQDLNQAVRAALTALRRRVAEKGLSMDTALDGGLPPVPVDAALLARLVAALLDNAVKYAPPDGTVRVLTERWPDGAHLVVEDSGPGIAAADLPHVFEPFYRADQARTRGDGTGLGLALAAAVVRVHGGRIAARNGAQGGAQLDVVLPYNLSN